MMAMTVIAAVAAPPARACDVVLRVDGVRNGHGEILAALCARADFLHRHCTWRGRAPAAAGETRITIHNVPPGRYAAQAFHDENGDQRLGRSLLGLPTEGIAVSRAAGASGKAWAAMPKFDDAAFDIGPAGGTVTLSLHYPP